MRLRPIKRSLDPHPLFPQELIPLFRWTADYYQFPLGEVIKTALPGGLTPKSSKVVVLLPKGRKHLDRLKAASDNEDISRLLRVGRLSPTLSKKIMRSPLKGVLNEWEKEGLIEIRPEVSHDRVGSKTEVCFCLAAASISDVADPPYSRPEKRTLELMEELQEEYKRKWITKRDLRRRYSGASKGLKLLMERSVIREERREVYRDPFGEQAPFFPTPENLTKEQIEVLEAIYPTIDANLFKSFLLHGITGSGKTEVYLRAAARVLAQGRSVLLLVPEIALASQLEGHFISRFGATVALLHSGLSAPERYDQWQRTLKGEAKIVIGARSAIFAPMRNLGLIIVDEEHDGAYKQDNALRYNGRDLAVVRGKQQGAVVILGSATPSINSYHNTVLGKYHLLEMKHRVAASRLPDIEVIDLKAIPTTTGFAPIFSPQLTQALRRNLQEGNQSLVFLNRRGYANLILCRHCGEAVTCRNCSITMTPHRHHNELICHYCGFRLPVPKVCPTCGAKEIAPQGFGTERIALELQNLFPTARISRLDQDTGGKRSDMLKILKDVYQQKVDILVGTQMIAKGHHFPHVTLVGVVWADAGLGIPDYRAGERTFQLLTQVFGRAGRGAKSGRVLVQTHTPEHYAILTSQEHDYPAMYRRELELRKRLAYPPFSRLINILLEGKSEDRVGRAALFLAKRAKRLGEGRVKILGPAPAPISRLRGLFRWQILIKSPDSQTGRNICSRLREIEVPGVPKNAVNLTVDVDPENML